MVLGVWSRVLAHKSDHSVTTTAVSRDNTLDTQAEDDDDSIPDRSENEADDVTTAATTSISRDNTVNEDEKVEDEILQEEKDDTTPARPSTAAPRPSNRELFGTDSDSDENFLFAGTTSVPRYRA